MGLLAKVQRIKETPRGKHVKQGDRSRPGARVDPAEGLQAADERRYLQQLDGMKRRIDHEMRERIAHLNVLEADLEKKAEQLRKKEKELDSRSRPEGPIGSSSESKRQARLQKDIEEKEALLDQLTRRIDREQKISARKGTKNVKESQALKEEWDRIGAKEKELQAAEEVIIKKESLLHELETHLQEKEQEIKKHEIEILDTEKDTELEGDRTKKLEILLRQKEQELLDQEQRMKTKTEEKNREIARLNQELNAKKEEMEHIDREIESTEVAASHSADDLIRERHLLKETEKTLQVREAQLKQKEHDLNDILIRLEQKHAALESMHALNQEKDKELNEKEEALRKQYGHQHLEAARLGDQVDEKQEMLERLTADEQTTRQQLEENIRLLKEKELEIVQRVRDLEDDQRLLDAREIEVRKAVTELEKEKADLDEREEGLIRTIKHLEEDKQFRELHRQALADKKIIKEKEKEVVKLVTRLEKDKERMEKAYFNKRLFEGKMAKLTKKEEELEERENELIRKERALAEAMRSTPSPRRVAPSKPTVSKDYTAAIKKIVFASSKKDTPRKMKAEDVPLTEMIAYTRGFINARDFPAARRSLSEVKKAYNKLKKPDLRRRYKYDLMELKNNLDLALLEA
ncbi:MAG: hypothetical protein GXP63_07680 [DPANN group archaeon]|nr:hypothetical protein [DPANN group archaeon]